MAQSEAHMRATNKWMANNKDRITIVVNKGEKAKIKAHAEKNGMSLNAYIVELIERDMEAGEKA